MNPDRTAAGSALILALWAAALHRAFARLTGMTLDQWDERNYQRIMAGAP